MSLWGILFIFTSLIEPGSIVCWTIFGEKLVKIALTNRNQHASDRQVIINLMTGLCTFADNREIELKQLISTTDFNHPLLTESPAQGINNLFHYEYDTIDGLLQSAIYVYATLLHVDKPLACHFKISPSPAFKRSTVAGDIHFSIQGHKVAQESICIRQLNALISQLSHINFKFSDAILIDNLFTIEDLPFSIDGDALYETHPNIVDLLKNTDDLNRYELRYIGYDIGFGVFCRDAINKGDVISLYSGVKTIESSTTSRYAFKSKKDCLNMYIDARLYGNITRFINHAPGIRTNKNSPSSVPLPEANVAATSYYLNGIQVIIYSAQRDVLKGEQLLMDYGANFFKKARVSRFKINGQAVDGRKKFRRKNAQKQLNNLRIMADHGVQKAQRYLRLRTLTISVVICIFMGMLNYL